MQGQILVIRIAGKVKNRKKDNETLNRLKLRKKFSSRLVKSKDLIRVGMVESVSHMVTYGEVNDEFIKELNSKRPAKENVHFLHPPIGGLKKSSKIAYPKGILGENKDIIKLAKRML